MPFDDTTLTNWLAAIGVTADDDRNANLVLAEQLTRQQLDRDTDWATDESILNALGSGLGISDIQVALRGSYERLVRDGDVVGHNSDAFRRLTAVASIERLSASSTDVAECVAVYRLILGREPDPAGFTLFLSYRHNQSLSAAVREIVASPEAAGYFAPDPPPSLTTALPAVLLGAGQVLHAVASDTTLGKLVGVDATVAKLDTRLDALEKKLDRYMEMVLLRLDADALER